MVKICSSNYSNENEEKYKKYFEKYSYELSTFQKHAIEAIVEEQHVLVTAHTGSGKSLPAEFAIEHFVSMGKKVIYTSPIKALSNQKFYDFTQKFPNISVGLITGDIRCNPQADVIIMTTEILLNKLYQNNSNNQKIETSISFEMDFQTELACVVFDEVHYINDQERGKIWELSIMLLPLHVQMVMLSATLDKAEQFALWCETKGNHINNSNKIVYLTTTNHRVVPLTHYSFITSPSGIFKAIKDKSVQEEIKNMINKPFVIQSAKGEFNEEHYYKMTKMLKLFENKQVYVKRQHVLNQVAKYMVENEILPALCFMFSRKSLEICAKEITTNLLEFDSKVPYIIDRECENIIRKLPNYQEYLNLPEYVDMVSLLRKGIAIHHAGVMPVLREMVEILYGKGYIKLLFVTETFSVGINMPTKTVIFTDVNKFDGNGQRILHSHEYTQMAGRAGRRGLDTVGHVIHLNNLFRNVDCVSYKNMLKGKPQTLVSKFKISFNLLLNLIETKNNNICSFAKRSMIQNDIEGQLREQKEKINKMQKELEGFDLRFLRTPIDVVNNYIDLLEKRDTVVNKKRKDVDRHIQQILDMHKFIEPDKVSVFSHKQKMAELDKLEKEYLDTNMYLDNNVYTILKWLEREQFSFINTEGCFSLNLKGKIACHLREIHCLIFADFLTNKDYKNFSSKQLASIFSCFTNVSVSEDYKSINPDCIDNNVSQIMKKFEKSYIDYKEQENMLGISTGTDYNIHFDLLNTVLKWCDASNEEECKYVIQILQEEKGIFLGEFVKALLKINNIVSEMEVVAELLCDIEFLSRLKEIPNITLKYIATNQSLYI